MTIRVAINGYGRIGRNILRAHYEGGKKHDIEIVAINDLGDAATNAHLTQYDTAHGRFPGEVSIDGDSLVVNGDKIKVDVKNGIMELLVSDEIIKERIENYKPVLPEIKSGYQKMYIDHVMQADKGADLDFLIGRRGSEVKRHSH